MLEIQEANVIVQTVKYVKRTLYKECTGHDWWHIYRVWKMAKRLHSHYNTTDKMVIELSALLHDMADWKANNGDFKAGSRLAKNWLCRFQGITKQQVSHVCSIIENISFKGSKAQTPLLSLEGQIVQDADRLDAMGAIGIARTFAYGGHNGRLIYDPKLAQKIHKTEFAYINQRNESTSINHFYEKLLVIKDLMNTEIAKAIAEKRHDFMAMYLSQFYTEWHGKG